MLSATLALAPGMANASAWAGVIEGAVTFLWVSYVLILGLAALIVSLFLSLLRIFRNTAGYLLYWHAVSGAANAAMRP